LLVLLVAFAASVLSLAPASPSLAAPEKKKCRTVIEIVHGHKKKVRICPKPKPKRRFRPRPIRSPSR
jgi:hypothetical protein